MSDQEPIKIVIPIEEEEPPVRAEQPASGARATAGEATRKVTGLAVTAAQRAAQSDVGRKAAGKVQEVADKGVRYVGTHMADTAEAQAKETIEAVQVRFKQTDWEKEAKVGIASGLHWLSGRLNDLSARIAAQGEKSPPDTD
ncbi:MAG: hypothetical protein ACK2UK_16410 [Candidatus Promineifilaceae bacterium]